MTQTFIDTLMVCSFTGLAIIATGAWQSGLDGPGLTQRAFAVGLPGQWGGIVVTVSLALFAFSTILGGRTTERRVWSTCSAREPSCLTESRS